MATQNQTMRFQREVARCPACEAALMGEFVVQFGSDAVMPIKPTDQDPGKRFEVTGHLAGVRIDAHDCRPKTYRTPDRVMPVEDPLTPEKQLRRDALLK